MKNKVMLFLGAIFVVFLFLADAHAVVEWNVEKTFTLETPPLDVAVSGKGQWVFVLFEGGKLVIYASDGTRKDTIMVGKHVDGIEVGPKEDVLYLTSRKSAIVEQIVLDFVYDINIKGAPFKGAANAPVAIAVFSDFQ